MATFVLGESLWSVDSEVSYEWTFSLDIHYPSKFESVTSSSKKSLGALDNLEGKWRWEWYKYIVDDCLESMLTWVHPISPVLSIRLDIFTVSPQMSYWGFLDPMTPATTGPWLIPMRSVKLLKDCLLISSSFSRRANENSRSTSKCFQFVASLPWKYKCNHNPVNSYTLD